MKTLAGVAHGLSRNLVERAADVMLKEKRRLVIVPREAPMSLPQLKNMVLCAEAGAMILPAMPAFYQMPKTLDDLADFMAGKILSALGFDQTLYPKWNGIAVDKSPARISAMFDAIARRYDFLNHVLSAGLDIRWRARAIRDARAAGRCPRPRSLHRHGGSSRSRRSAARRTRASSASISPARCCASASRSCAARDLSTTITLVRGDATQHSRSGRLG